MANFRKKNCNELNLKFFYYYKYNGHMGKIGRGRERIGFQKEELQLTKFKIFLLL